MKEMLLIWTSNIIPIEKIVNGVQMVFNLSSTNHSNIQEGFPNHVMLDPAILDYLMEDIVEHFLIVAINPNLESSPLLNKKIPPFSRDVELNFEYIKSVELPSSIAIDPNQSMLMLILLQKFKYVIKWFLLLIMFHLLIV